MKTTRASGLYTFHLLLALSCTNLFAAPNDNWDDRFGLPGVNPAVETLAASGTDVYVGGRFTQAGESNIAYVARWDGRRFWSLGAGISNTVNYNDFVYALTPSGTNLYVGGGFRVVGTNVNSSLIAKWDGNNWSALGAGITDPGSTPPCSRLPCWATTSTPRVRSKWLAA